MKDVIVGVRMPRTMLNTLKALAKKNHYMDVSEEIRSVIKDKTARYATPYSQDVKRIVDDLKTELAGREQSGRREQTITQLKKILEDLEREK